MRDGVPAAGAFPSGGQTHYLAGMSESKSAIFGSAGKRLTQEERAFYRGERPWGFILFARNVGEPAEIADLVAEMRDCVERPDAPVFIDQEGGRVQRLRPPLAPKYPPAAELGAIHAADAPSGLRAAWLMSRLHAFDLMRFGINADCLPVLDVPVEGAHDVIGNRAYAKDPAAVAAMGRAAADGLMAGCVLPVMKHVPGHGRAFSDSHLALPVVDAPLGELRTRDFAPFAALRDLPMAMTAHVVYTALDPDRPATTSPRVVAEIIRGEIGFDGLLMSDDVSMRALSGDFGEKARAILAAGCDVVLHCNGVMDEMRAVAAGTGPMTPQAARRAEAALALALLGRADGSDESALREEFAALTGAIA
jgi:beta-N-acetylhexosaminidase